jgi:hypothetical protein
MRWELRQIANLTADDQAALRTLALAVYPPDVATAWPGRAIEWGAARVECHRLERRRCCPVLRRCHSPGRSVECEARASRRHRWRQDAPRLARARTCQHGDQAGAGHFPTPGGCGFRAAGLRVGLGPVLRAPGLAPVPRRPVRGAEAGDRAVHVQLADDDAASLARASYRDDRPAGAALCSHWPCPNQPPRLAASTEYVGSASSHLTSPDGP